MVKVRTRLAGPDGRLSLRNLYWRKQIASMPRVIKFDSVPWHSGPGGRQGKHFHEPEWSEPELKYPIRTMVINEQVFPPGGKSRTHRHFNEQITYVVEGRGYENHDGIRYNWEAGDVYSIPTHSDHAHFNADPERPARLLTITNEVVTCLLGINSLDQIRIEAEELPEDAVPIKDASGKPVGFRLSDGLEFLNGLEPLSKERMEWVRASTLVRMEPRTTYDRYVVQLREEYDFTLREQPHVVKGGSAPWENTRMGRQKWLVHPGVHCGIRINDVFVQELPPGGCSGKHRHASEEVHLILEGKGHDIQDGSRYDWEKEDVVCIPVDVVHQHFNADPSKPARFVAFQSRVPTLLGAGGIQHLEDAPEYCDY